MPSVFLLALAALICAGLSMVWGKIPFLPIAVVLLSIAFLVGAL